MTLYCRFKHLIAQDDVPRLKQVLQVCIKQGTGMQSIIEKIKNATTLVYKAKGKNIINKSNLI